MLVFGCSSNKPNRAQRGHFTLSGAEAKNLYHRTSNLRITVGDLEYWDNILSDLSKNHRLNRAGDTFRLYTYFYCAQKAFADASFQLTSAFSGSLDSISLEVIRLFYPDYQNDQLKTDSYSKELTAILMGQIKARFEKEEKNIHTMQLPKKEGLWVGDPPKELFIPSMKPWIMTSKSEFQSPKPPSPKDPKWDRELEGVKKEARSATNPQKERSYYWEEMTNPEGTNWTGIANQYMKEANVPLAMQIGFRDKFFMAMMDAMISVFNDKFIFMVARPIERDPNFKPLFKTPNHPSYPSAHSSISSAAATVLAYFFPENIDEWQRLADEAGISRLWAGIHFPMDNEAGLEQGNNVAKAVLFR